MLKIIFSLISVFVWSESAKILGVFPTPSISHQVVFRPVMLELVKRGHEVTVITTDPAFPKGQAPQNLTEIDLHDVSYEYWNELIAEIGNEKDQLKIFRRLGNLGLEVFRRQLGTAEIQKFLRNVNTFDLLLVESCARPALIFSHLLDIPVIEFSSLSGILLAFDVAGATTHPLFYPDAFHRKIYNLTLWEKITELYIHYSSERIFMELAYAENEILKRIFGFHIPSVNDLRQNVQILFLNVHPIWDFNRPFSPNVLYLGGLHQKPQKELTKDWKSYLDSSKNGVIYVSFGTNVKPSMLPLDKLKIFTEVFSQISYDVLWKWDKDELPGRSKNVKISKWLPQSDLLLHPKIRLFITQGGLQSTDEAITAGVPLIGVPMLGDQWFNVAQYVKLNIGKRLSIETLTEEQLINAISTVIDDESYRQNIVKLRNIMHDQPLSPLERAVWWTEHLLRHGGGAHLRAPAAHMHWTEYYELEILLLLLAALVFIVIVMLLAIILCITIFKHYFNMNDKLYKYAIYSFRIVSNNK